MATGERIDLDNLSPEDENLLVAALAEREVDRIDREAALIVARWEGFAAGRKAARQHLPEKHDAQTRRKLRDLAVARERKAVESDPDAHPLRAARVALDLSQRDAAAIAGFSRRTWWRLENGVGSPEWPTKVAAARVVGKSPADVGLRA